MMASIHLITTPRKPYTAHKVQEKPYFCNICPCANGIVYARFEDELLYERCLGFRPLGFRALPFFPH